MASEWFGGLATRMRGQRTMTVRLESGRTGLPPGVREGGRGRSRCEHDTSGHHALVREACHQPPGTWSNNGMQRTALRAAADAERYVANLAVSAIECRGN